MSSSVETEVTPTHAESFLRKEVGLSCGNTDPSLSLSNERHTTEQNS